MLRAELLLRPRRSPHSLLTAYSRLTHGLLPTKSTTHYEVRELRGGRWRSTHVLTSRRQERHTYHGHMPVPRLCHEEDRRADHSCQGHRDCGVSGETCAARHCSAFGFCFSAARQTVTA